MFVLGGALLTVTEDGKPQHIRVFEYQRLEDAELPPPPLAQRPAQTAPAAPVPDDRLPDRGDQDRRAHDPLPRIERPAGLIFAAAEITCHQEYDEHDDKNGKPLQ